MKTVHYSSDTVEWETPQTLFAELDREFGFELDVCATTENRKCARFYSPEVDGLKQPWAWAAFGGACWMNPPYGRGIEKWIRKASEQSQRGATVVALIPARTDTRWWHEYIQDKAEVRFIRGRVPFVRRDGIRSRAPFPSAIVVFRPAAPAHVGHTTTTTTKGQST